MHSTHKTPHRCYENQVILRTLWEGARVTIPSDQVGLIFLKALAKLSPKELGMEIGYEKCFMVVLYKKSPRVSSMVSILDCQRCFFNPLSNSWHMGKDCLSLETASLWPTGFEDADWRLIDVNHEKPFVISSFRFCIPCCCVESSKIYFKCLQISSTWSIMCKILTFHFFNMQPYLERQDWDVTAEASRSAQAQESSVFNHVSLFVIL